MKPIHFLAVILLAACNNNSPETDAIATPTDTVIKIPIDTQIKTDEPVDSVGANKIYSNQRFKDVTVEKIGEHTFRIQGKGQIFEASFNWVVEDGHEEIKNGYTTTDAGAPEWGKFSFTIDVPKKRENSKLNLILFEISAKDGSRQYELPVFLY